MQSASNYAKIYENDREWDVDLDKLLIVDGNNLLFQFFYGFPAKIHNKSGRTIHATIGFISAFQCMIRRYQIDRAVVVFDCDCSTERKELYEDYKANRPKDWDSLPPDEVPFFEEEYIRKCLEYLGVCVLDSKKMEADDLIASIALEESETSKVYILSYDSDFFQLLRENISIIRYKGENTKTISLQSFCEKFGFCPSSYPLYKALVGDSADNVKGVPMVGAKRATMIVKECEDFARLCESELLFLPLKARESVKDSLAIVERNLALIELKKKEIATSAFDFDKDKLEMRNSQILTACKVFG